jgi:hypothetical protein
MGSDIVASIIRQASREATRGIVFSLEPSRNDPSKFAPEVSVEHSDEISGILLHGYRIIGQAELKIEQVRLLAEKVAVDTALGLIDFMCIFEPRHAIRLIAENAATDILVCYSCGQIEIYDARGFTSGNISGVSGSEFSETLLSNGLNIAR